MDPPAAKKSKVDVENGDNSYIPVQPPSAEASANLSLIFSLKDEQGSLLKSLKPFQVCVRLPEVLWDVLLHA